jgi:hypothetical protein
VGPRLRRLARRRAKLDELNPLLPQHSTSQQVVRVAGRAGRHRRLDRSCCPIPAFAALRRCRVRLPSATARRHRRLDRLELGKDPPARRPPPPSHARPHAWLFRRM